MRDFDNKEEVQKRVNILRESPEFRMPCPFCGCSSRNFYLLDKIVEIDNQSFVQIFCNKCGYSMFLDYKVLMKKGNKDE